MTADNITNLIIAIVAGGFAFAGTALTVSAGRKKDALENAIRDQKIEDKLQALSDRVDAHNNIMDKVTEMSSDMKAMKTDVEWLKKEHQK